MKKVAVVITILSLFAIFASPSFAVPIEINYQGYLADSGGPVNVPTNMSFKLYDNLDALQWDSGVTSVPVVNGVYNIILGAAPQPAIDPAIFTKDLWLGITVNGEAFSPRQKLVSAPYAMAAEVTSSLAPGVVPCNPGDFVNCYTGQAGTMYTAPCTYGIRTCGPDGVFGGCVGEVTPAVEYCNGLDDDCNGIIDDNAFDGDGDGWAACDGDCDDTDSSINPGVSPLNIFSVAPNTWFVGESIDVILDITDVSVSGNSPIEVIVGGLSLPFFVISTTQIQFAVPSSLGVGIYDIEVVSHSCPQSDTLIDAFSIDPICYPDCAGKDCGPDGCGGTCGDCQPGDVCDVSGTCVAQ